MKKILLAGGFGFAGKNIIETLYPDYKIIVVGRRKDAFFMEKYPDLSFYRYDFGNDTDLHEIIQSEAPDFIFNLVSIVTAEREMGKFQEMLHLNVNVLLELYKASAGVNNLKLFLQFGSGEEYGNIAAPFKESDREFPGSPYALSKQICTNTSLMLYNNYYFPISVVRPGNIFGKYQAPDKFVPYILSRLIKNEKIETTKGEQKRDFIYAPDFAKGIAMVLKSYRNFKGQIFNLSSGEAIRLKDLIMFCKSYLGSHSEVDFGKIPYRENEMMNFELDTLKFRELSNSTFEMNTLKSLSKFIHIRGGIFE